MEKVFFGLTKNGDEVFKYILFDDEGNSVSILNYGATVQSLVIDGRDVVLGYDNVADYESDEDRKYFGAVCGRVANRVQNGKFYIEGTEYNLYKNNGNHSLHGGKDGFDKKIFKVVDFSKDSIVLSLVSPDGDENYPGELYLDVKYSFKNKLLLIEYFASVSESCPVNITNHSYFNLDGKGNILSHKLKLNSKYYLEDDDSVCATGVVLKTAGTAFDFTEEKELKENIFRARDEQPLVGGIDHHFFADSSVTQYRKFATLTSSDEKIKMDVFTNQCGAQIYTGNFLETAVLKGETYEKFGGIAIETQFPPNNLNNSHLPSMMLHKGERYYHKTGYKFY